MFSRLVPVLLVILVGCSEAYRVGLPRPESGANGPTPPHAPQGANVGNGGDYLSVLFEQGRSYAVGMLERIHPEQMPETLKRNISENEKQWLIAHRQELADDVRQSPHLPPVEKSEHPDFVCAFTQPAPRAAVGLLTSCEHSVGRGIRAAAVVLIHESLHHLHGADEGFANRLAAGVALLWSALGHPETPHWVKIPADLFLRKGDDVPLGLEPTRNDDVADHGWSDPVWTGKELMLWNEDRLAYYDPRTGKWREGRARNAQPRVKNETWRARSSSEWVTGKVVQFIACPTESEAKVSRGSLYDPTSNRWETISVQGAPSLRRDFVQVSLGDKLMVWGGTPCHDGFDHPAYLNDGSLFDPVTNSWKPISSAEAPARAWSWWHSYAWSGKELFTWNGYGVEPSASPGNVYSRQDGAIYDRERDRWSAVPSPGAPDMDNVQVVWAAGRFVVLSGSYPLEMGAQYDPVAKKWETVSMEGLESGHSAAFYSNPISSGENVIVISPYDTYLFSPRENRWRKTSALTPPHKPTALIWTGMELFYWGENHLYAFYLE